MIDERVKFLNKDVVIEPYSIYIFEGTIENRAYFRSHETGSLTGKGFDIVNSLIEKKRSQSSLNRVNYSDPKWSLLLLSLF